MMQNGFFWYCVPMTLSGEPFWMAAAVESSDVTATSALAVSTTVSWGVAVGPAGIRFTPVKPCWV